MGVATRQRDHLRTDRHERCNITRVEPPVDAVAIERIKRRVGLIAFNPRAVRAKRIEDILANPFVELLFPVIGRGNPLLKEELRELLHIRLRRLLVCCSRSNHRRCIRDYCLAISREILVTVDLYQIIRLAADVELVREDADSDRPLPIFNPYSKGQ